MPPPGDGEKEMERDELREAIIAAMERSGERPVIDCLIGWIEKGLFLEIFAEIQDETI